jgi:hypothetical protein
VCSLLAVVFLTSFTGAARPPAGAHAPHRYSDYDPSWTQLAFPRLGSPLAPATSPTAVLTRLANTPGEPGSRLSILAAATHIAALLLFWVVARELGISPVATAAATIALGLEPAFFGVATQWTPYAALPALILAATLARLKVLDHNAGAWRIVLMATSLAAVADAVYVIPIVLALMWAPGAAPAGAGATARVRVTTSAWRSVLVIAAGLALQVLGAAVAWRDARLAVDQSAPWRDAIVAATSRWGRLIEIYAVAPLPDLLHRLRETIGALGLLVPSLAVVGLLALFRTNRQWAWLLLAAIAAALVMDVAAQAPAAAVSPALPLLVVLTFLVAAAGLTELVRTFRRPTAALLCFGAILAGDGLAARRLSALDKSAWAALDVTTAVAGLPRPSSLVASDVELDRRLAATLETSSPSATIGRLPQTFAAIRDAHAAGDRLFVWPADVLRVASLGWILAPADARGTSVASMYEAIEPTVCGLLSGEAPVEIGPPLASGSISMLAERGSAYQVEIEGDGLSDRMTAIDIVTGRPLTLVHRDSTHVLVSADRARRTLPRLDFPAAPDRARARLLTTDPAQRVRVCGAPARGEAIRLEPGGGSVALPIESRSIFEAGWHPVEPAGTNRFKRWSNGAAGLIVMQIPGEPTALEIVVEALPAAPASRAPTLTVAVNQQLLPPQPMLPGARPYTWTINRGALRRGLNVFRLSVPEAFSPRSLGVSEDDRRLGFELSAFRVRRLP